MKNPTPHQFVVTTSSNIIFLARNGVTCIMQLPFQVLYKSNSRTKRGRFMKDGKDATY
jgi:hypothetical protein